MTSWHEYHQYSLENGGMDDPHYCPGCGVYTASGVFCEDCCLKDNPDGPDEAEVCMCGLTAEEHVYPTVDHNFIPKEEVMPGSISDSYNGPADPCPKCNPNGIPSGHATPHCIFCAGTYWLPDGDCFICKQPADGYYQGRQEFPSCGSRNCELKMQGGIDAHDHGCNR